MFLLLSTEHSFKSSAGKLLDVHMFQTAEEAIEDQ